MFLQSLSPISMGEKALKLFHAILKAGCPGCDKWHDVEINGAKQSWVFITLFNQIVFNSEIGLAITSIF